MNSGIRKNSTKRRFDRETVTAFVIVLSGILMSCITSVFGYDILPDYQDKLVHLRRIAALADTLKAGYFPARIYFVMNQGTGYAMPVFYPDLFLYVPAFLYIAGIPLGMAYDIYVIIINTLTGLIAYFCLKGFLGSEKINAAVMSFVYTLSVYRLTDVYIRDAAGEYTAMAFLPLVVYGFYRIYALNPGKEKGGENNGEDDREKNCRKGNLSDEIKAGLPLGIGMALLLSSHILTTFMSCAFLAVLALVLFRRTFTKKVLIRLVSAALICIMLSAYFIVPFVDYMLADEYLVSASSETMRGFYPGISDLFELIPGGSGSGIVYELRMPTQIGVAITVILATWIIYFLIACAVLVIKGEYAKLKSERMITGIILSAMCLVMLFISSRYFPWEAIESKGGLVARLMCSVQFSWRYIGPSTAVSVFLGAVLLSQMSEVTRKRARIFGILILILAVIPGAVLQKRACEENRHVAISAGEEIGIVSDELYFPVSWNRDAEYNGVPASSEGTEVISYDVDKYRWKVSVSNTGITDGCVLLPIVFYKGYESVTDDGMKLNTLQGTDGRIMIMIPSGYSGNFTLEYTVPGYWRLSEIISLISIAFVCMMLSAGDCRIYIGGKKNKSTDNGIE